MQKKYLFLIPGLIILGLGIFYFQTKNPDKLAEMEPSDVNQGTEANTETSVGDDTLDEKVGGDFKMKDENKTLFDEALKNGSTELNKANYDGAVAYFNEALKYKNSGVVYVRLSSAYSAKGDKVKALEMINKAIELDSFYTDYWVTKLYLMSSMGSGVNELKAVYIDGLDKVNPKTKINLVTSFARIVEEKKDYAYAVSLWEEAQKIYPDHKAIYQSEIDRLKTLIN